MENEKLLDIKDLKGLVALGEVTEIEELQLGESLLLKLTFEGREETSSHLFTPEDIESGKDKLIALLVTYETQKRIRNLHDTSRDNREGILLENHDTKENLVEFSGKDFLLTEYSVCNPDMEDQEKELKYLIEKMKCDLENLGFEEF